MSSVYPFTEAEFQEAYRSWGCNCGPSALAFATRNTLDRVHAAIEGFDEKRYTNPTMMRRALHVLSYGFIEHPNLCKGSVGDGLMSLVRIQWTGPWTAPGSNPRWAYGHTHWIAAWTSGQGRYVFDCNGGVRTFESWEANIAPVLAAMTPRRDGGWCPTHIWELAHEGPVIPPAA